MTNHELRCLEPNDQVRIRGSRRLYLVVNQADVTPRDKANGLTSSTVRVKAFDARHGTASFEVNGKALVQPEVKSQRREPSYYKPVRSKRAS